MSPIQTLYVNPGDTVQYISKFMNTGQNAQHITTYTIV